MSGHLYATCLRSGKASLSECHKFRPGDEWEVGEGGWGRVGRVFQKEEAADDSHHQEFKEQKVRQHCILACEEREARHVTEQVGGIMESLLSPCYCIWTFGKDNRET